MTSEVGVSTIPIRAGVIGCGVQGQAHLTELTRIDGVEVVAIADLDGERLAAAGERFSVERRYTDASRLLEDGLDLVCVCTMPDTHRDFVTGALERGSHVLCEKPFARHAAEAVDMVRAAERADRLLMVGFNMRFMGASSAIRGFVQDGLLGDLVCARGFMLTGDVPWWGRHYVREVSGGGVLAAAGVHMLDLLMWLAGHPRPLTATASTATLFPHKRGAGAPAGAAERYDVEDLVFGHVRFEGGFWLTIEGSWTYDRPGSNHGFDAFGTRGQAHFAPLALYTDRDGASVRVREDASAEPDFAGALRLEMREVVESVRAGRVCGRVATGHQALAVQAVTDALYRSARERSEVEVEPEPLALAE